MLLSSFDITKQGYKKKANTNKIENKSVFTNGAPGG
jgi:hypothetical protein